MNKMLMSIIHNLLIDMLISKESIEIKINRLQIMGKILMFSPNIKDQEVMLGEAFTYIDQVLTNEQGRDDFIGFVNENDETIQFVRFTANEWLFDLPLIDQYTGKWNFQTLQLENISTSLVKRIVENFFSDPNLLQKIKSRYKLEEPEVQGDITYFKIDTEFVHWIEIHNNQDEIYS